MDFVTVGATGITVNKNGFGALPIQRISVDDAVYLVRKAYDNEITFFDTARGYTDSEVKLGIALSDVREKVVIATKSHAQDGQSFNNSLETSLANIKTGYVDIMQFHNPPFCPKPGDESGLYDVALEAKAQGKIKHIGITNHRLDVAIEAANSGLYETIQYPISYISSKEELDFIALCKEKNIGILAMKALSGGLITDSAAAYAFLAQFDNVIPIWGIQRENELDEFLAFHDAPPVLDERALAIIEKDKAELTGNFCRACGYCMPCPQGIGIPSAARMLVLMKRAPKSMYLSEECQNAMAHAKDCTNCGHCIAHCPYGIDVPRLVAAGWEEYKKLV
jgi:predicted aldo/keto reductase-like oxidoreductase